MIRINSNEAKTVKREIIVGIITAAICWLIEWIIRNAPQTGRTVSSTLQNLIFSCTAQISSNSILILIFVILLTFMTAISISPIIFNIADSINNKRLRKLQNSLTTIETNIARIERDLPNSETEVEITKEELNTLNRQFDQYQKTQKRNPLNIVLVILILFYLIFVILTIVIPISLLNKFNIDIQMIKPYTDSSTIEMLESDWTRMKSSEDYESIYSIINEIKRDNAL